jgi:hypothetical protein
MDLYNFENGGSYCNFFCGRKIKKNPGFILILCMHLISMFRILVWKHARIGLYLVSEAHPRGGYRAAAPPQTTQNQNLKNTDFVDIISNVLRDLPFSLNQPLKSAND